MKSRKKEYILMFKDEEVLSFSISFGRRNKLEVKEKLAHFDRAPFGLEDNLTMEELSDKLSNFFYKRTIPPTRYGIEEILKATKCESSLELSFKGHGLSLSTHYWFKQKDENLKYDDINFFSNPWDDSFGKALLRQDYEALAHVSYEVPDIVTNGWAEKGWIYDNGPKLYKLGIAPGQIEESLSEVLTSRLARRMFNDESVLHYELKKIGDRYASVSKAMLGIDEELIPLSVVVPRELHKLYAGKGNDRDVTERFFKEIENSNIPHLHDFFVKLNCLRSLCFLNDLHMDNISVIRNLKTKEIRIAPLYDLAGAFGSTQRGKEFLSNLTQGSFLVVYFIYGNLDKNWDYSWFDPKTLDGFEDDIREILSKSDFYTPILIENIIQTYNSQKEALINLANEQREREKNKE